MLPLAHLGHWLWIFYVLPVIIVIAGILRGSLLAKRREQQQLPERRRDSAEYDLGREPTRDGDPPPAGGAGRDPENGGAAPARRGPSR